MNPRRLATVVAMLAVVLAGCGGSGNAAPPDTTVRQLRQFRILFPEGFTRAQMVARVLALESLTPSGSVLDQLGEREIEILNLLGAATLA